jgi:hypothetical protein
VKQEKFPTELQRPIACEKVAVFCCFNGCKERDFYLDELIKPIFFDVNF